MTLEEIFYMRSVAEASNKDLANALEKIHTYHDWAQKMIKKEIARRLERDNDGNL